MTVVADYGFVFMRLMTLRTFEIVRFKDMVVMRIEFKSPVAVGSFGDCIKRVVVLACKA